MPFTEILISDNHNTRPCNSVHEYIKNERLHSLLKDTTKYSFKRKMLPKILEEISQWYHYRENYFLSLVMSIRCITVPQSIHDRVTASRFGISFSFKLLEKQSINSILGELNKICARNQCYNNRNMILLRAISVVWNISPRH